MDVAARIDGGSEDACLGRFDEAFGEMKRAQEIDPLSLIINADTGEVFFLAHQTDQAIAQFRKTIEMDENFGYAHNYLAQAYVQKGMYDEAVAEYLTAAADNSENQSRITTLRDAYRVSGWRGFLQKRLDLMKEDLRERYITSYNMATVYAGLGEKDQAFRWLQKAIEEHSSPPLYLRGGPQARRPSLGPTLHGLAAPSWTAAGAVASAQGCHPRIARRSARRQPYGQAPAKNFGHPLAARSSPFIR